MTKPKPPADLWEQIDAAYEQMLSAPPDPRPPGVFTRDEYQKAHPGMGAQHAQRKITCMIKAGKLEKVKIWSRNQRGFWTRRDGYRLKTK